MPALDGLGVAPQTRDRLLTALVAAPAPSSPTAPLYVTVPALGNQRWGPCTYSPADTPPVLDAQCLVAIDETDNAWVVAWVGVLGPAAVPYVDPLMAPYNAAGDGVTDDTAALQAALNAVPASAAGGRMHLRAGRTFKISAALTKTTAGPLVIDGAATIVQSANADVFSVTLTGGGRLNVSDLKILSASGGAMTNTAAIRVLGNFQLPTATVRDVQIQCTALSEFTYGVHKTNCAETRDENVVIYSAGTGLTGWFLTTTVPANGGAHKLSKCSQYGGLQGMRVSSTTNAGVEGVQCYGCDFVNVSYGVYAVSTVSVLTYVPPQVLISGGHIAASVENVHLERYTQCELAGVLLYNTGSTTIVNLVDCAFTKIHDCELVAVGGDPDGITYSAPNGGTGSLEIHDNNFILKVGTAKVCVKSTTDVVNTIDIHDNVSSTPGVKFATLGYFDASTMSLRNNRPLDIEDITATVSPLATDTTLDFTGLRAMGSVQVATATGTTTISAVKTRRGGETLTLVWAGGGTALVLKHGVSVGGFTTMILKSQVDFTFTYAGQAITLYNDGSYWREIGRT